MKNLSASVTNTFNLLSIGQRGVGKTVFLAGSYAELHSTDQISQPHPLWFDVRESQDEEKIERILNYVAQTGQYPPATMRITNFNFSLKRSGLWGTKTLCHFRWWDIPGESCNTSNPEFQKIVLSSHGCCVFINAQALINDRAYLQPLEEMIKQVVAIASLVNQHRLKYAFALIFTKCDLLDGDPINLLQIEERVQPLLTRLDAVNANYQKFYSAIPIVSFAAVPTLKAKGAAAPLLWLVSELRKLHSVQVRYDLGSGLKQSITNSDRRAYTAKNVLGLLRLNYRSSTLLLSLAGVSLVGVCAVLFILSPFAPKQSQASNGRIRQYEQILQAEPNNFDALFGLANLHIEMGQPDQAIPLMEKLVQQEPDRLDLHLNLAQLYKSLGQKQKAETAYDRILLQENNNLAALVNKAVLRNEQGDYKTAKALFVQAEQAAPASLKVKIHAIANNTLPATIPTTQVSKSKESQVTSHKSE